MTTPMMPKTPQRDHLRTFHGDTVNDVYEWLRDKNDPEVLSWLNAQNDYADAMTADQEPLRRALFDEFSARIKQTDMSTPVRRKDWWYFTRTAEGQQYGCRVRVPVSEYPERPVVSPNEMLTGEQVVLDSNAEAAGHEFFSLGSLSISPDQDHLGFSIDVAGDERFNVQVRNIASGEVIDEAVTGVGYGLVWSTDGAYFWYTRVDDAWRPHQVWRHKIGSSAADDVLIYEENDEKYWMGIHQSDDDQYLMVSCGSKITSETRLLPRAEPLAELRTVAPREDGIEYDVACAGDRLIITHNEHRDDFEVATAPLDAVSREQWEPWITPADGERVLGVSAFESHLVLSTRSGGLTGLQVCARSADSDAGFTDPEPVAFAQDLYTAHLANNPEYRTQTLLLSFQSMVTPAQVIEYDLSTGEQRVIKTQEVLGGVDLENYQQYRTWAEAADGTKIPVSVVHHKDTPLDGTAPCMLYGYGSYEHSIDPTFGVTRLSLLDRGVIFAIAHIRGGGEMGRAWYNQGKMGSKRNTFTDFIAAADHLASSGQVDGDRMAAMGGSAGGLLMGAVMNLAPQRFRAIHAAVPFVDSLTTILNPEMPLTVPEWEEWGDPLHDAEAYRYIKSYAPYENVEAKHYPAVLATTSLNDTRVFFTEPAKWVAKLQDMALNDPATHPILLKTEMVAGHGGKSGRYDAWRELAFEMSFLLTQLGATDTVRG